MAIKIQIPTPMRQHTDGQTKIEVAGGTVQEALTDLGVKYPALAARIFPDGKLRQYINIYVPDAEGKLEDIRYLDNLNTRVKDGDEVEIMAAVAGG